MNRAAIFHIETARAANREKIFFLRITVYIKISVRQMFSVQTLRPAHSGLFINRNNGAKRSMGLGRVTKEIQDLSDACAIIGAQTRPFGQKIFRRPHQPNRIVLGIVRYPFVSDAHHIHMPLQDRARRLFIARCRLQISNDIIRFVLHDLAAQFSKRLLQVIADGLLMPRRPWNFR